MSLLLQREFAKEEVKGESTLNGIDNESLKMATAHSAPEEFRLLVTTWNVGNAAPGPLQYLVEPLKIDAEINVAVFGAQEATYARGSPALFSLLEEAMGADWVRVQISTLGQMKLGVYVRNKLRPYVIDVVSAVERCGFGDVVSNKGGIAIRLTILHHTFVFVSTHLEAHEGEHQRLIMAENSLFVRCSWLPALVFSMERWWVECGALAAWIFRSLLLSRPPLPVHMHLRDGHGLISFFPGCGCQFAAPRRSRCRCCV
jgi:hypothetical protein